LRAAKPVIEFVIPISLLARDLPFCRISLPAAIRSVYLYEQVTFVAVALTLSVFARAADPVSPAYQSDRCGTTNGGRGEKLAGWDWSDVVRSAGAGMTGTRGRGYAPLQEVRAYWEGLRRDGGLPDRMDIDPRGMDQALAHVFLLERIAPGVARFRVAGMHFTEVMGMEVRGMPLTAMLEPASRGPAATLLEDVFSMPAIVELAVQAQTGLGRGPLDGRMVILPVSDNGVCDRALGCFVTLGTIGRVPRRFQVVRQRTERLRPAGGLAAAAAETASHAFAEAPAPFMGQDAARPQRSRAHLRLVLPDE
jgi:hypothetical protein